MTRMTPRRRTETLMLIGWALIAAITLKLVAAPIVPEIIAASAARSLGPPMPIPGDE